MEKEFQYAIKINEQIAAIFDSDCDNFIDLKELSDEDNAKAFLHALANIVPAQIFNKLTGDDKDLLQFNHAANHLVFEFTTKES